MAKKVVHGACPHDCPDACGVLITVEDGRATKIQGDSKHPFTRGYLCAKVAKYLDRVYSPERVLYPMRRIGAKGAARQERSSAPGQPGAAVPTQSESTQSQTWQRISWDEALDEIASRFRAITGEFGNEAILPYSYGVDAPHYSAGVETARAELSKDYQLFEFRPSWAGEEYKGMRQ